MNDDEWRSKSEKLKKQVREQPEDGEAWFQLAEFFHRECDNPEYAVRAYEKAQQYLPQQDLRLKLGMAYATAGAIDRGIAILRAYVQEKPCSHGYVMLAEALRKADHPEEARRALEMAIRLEPTFEESHFLMGRLTRADSRETAIACYRQAVSLDPDYQLAWRDLGAVLADDPATSEDGVKALCRAIALNSEDGWAHLFLAICYWKTHRIKDADLEYRRAIRAFPGYPFCRKCHAQFLASVRDCSEIWDRRVVRRASRTAASSRTARSNTTNEDASLQCNRGAFAASVRRHYWFGLGTAMAKECWRRVERIG